MPSKTPKQARFMAAVAHNPSFAKKVGVPQSVGEEFNEADEMKKTPKKTTQHKKRVRAMGKIARKASRTYG